MRALVPLFILSLAAGCASAYEDFQPGYIMANPPLVNPVYDDRQVRSRPMDPARNVAEQDCSQRVDLSRGNLLCK